MRADGRELVTGFAEVTKVYVKTAPVNMNTHVNVSLIVQRPYTKRWQPNASVRMMLAVGNH